MAAWLRLSAMGQAVRCVVSSSGSPSATQPWPRLVHDGRGCDAPPSKHCPSGYLRPHSDKVDVMLKKLNQTKIIMEKKELLSGSIQDLLMDHQRKIVAPSFARAWQVVGIVILGVTIGYHMGVDLDPNSMKRSA